MKNIARLSFLPVIAGLLLAFLSYKKEGTTMQGMGEIPVCGSVTANSVIPAADGKLIGPMPGWGKYSFPISTKIDSAQFYFDQGINLYYGYHMKESLASFMEAARLDPSCAMTWWGQALAAGPYYNAAHTYKMPAEIPGILSKMNGALANASTREKALIATMNVRYSDDLSDSKRKELNAAYASGMRRMADQYPEDNDIHMLYVDAQMLIHPWDFWNPDGSAKAWTPELVTISESVLRKSPDHPAALHYHIHLTEASKHPEVALPNADKLKNLLPGIPHMVHMASHEYQRNGLYEKGVEVNDRADENLLKYDALAKNLSLPKHSPHYFAVQTYCALTGGMYETGMRDAIRCRKSVKPTPETTYDQYLYMLPSLTLVRLGKWDEILKDNDTPPENWSYASVLSHFSRGMAFVNTGQTELAMKELAALQINAKDKSLEKRRIPFNAPVQIANISEKILDASILYAQKNPEAAISALHQAIQLEDNLIYTEPHDWPLPGRQYLGAILLRLNKTGEAEKVYTEDLIRNPGNGWSLIGLHQSLQLQKKNKTLVTLKSGFQKSFSGAEVIPTASVYMKL